MIGAVVLAAGRSRRMGAPKLLLPLAGKPVIAHVVDQLLASPVGEVRVVVGPVASGVTDALVGRLVRLVTNPDLDGDMLSSVRCGVRGLPSGCEGVVVALGDQPGITAGLVGRLVEELRSHNRAIVVPTYGGRRGHPLLFSIHHLPEVLGGHAGIGLRGLLGAHPADVLEVEVDEPAVLEDMDTPADYERIARSFETPEAD